VDFSARSTRRMYHARKRKTAGTRMISIFPVDEPDASSGLDLRVCLQSDGAGMSDQDRRENKVLAKYLDEN
jgi:hypothetical protein